MNERMLPAMAAAALAALAVALPAAGRAQELPTDRRTFWDVRPGQHWRDLDVAAFTEYACGTNGGPPALRIAGWSEFARCRPEPGGLHEVQYRYDDEPEYIARAFHADAQIAATEGTKMFIIPVIVSALFDDDGFVVATRAMTDPRVTPEERLQAVSLQNFLMARFGPDDWRCVDALPAAGETPIGGVYRNQRCTKTRDGLNLAIEAYFFRKAGQVGIDPRTQEPVAGQFRSDVRFEMALDAPVPDRAARLAAFAASPPAPTAAEANRARAASCPGCDFANADLKRQDLSGANLAGANLAGANLHGANLSRANLAGANLAGANLNHTTMTLANLAGADLREAMFFGAAMDGADLSGATLTEARMGEARLTRANFAGATALAVDFTAARLANTSFRDARLGGSWFVEAELSRADLENGDFLQALLTNAKLTNANLAGAKFIGADLFGADLRGANLAGTDFTGSRLQSALLTGTRRELANFTDVFGLPP